MRKLKQRWGIESNLKLVLVLLVFALTGSASAWFSRPLVEWFGITKVIFGNWFQPIRFLVIFITYQILLLLNGFIFGQFRFFWAFEKKIIKALGFGFLLPKNKEN